MNKRGQVLLFVLVVATVLSLFAATLFFMIIHEGRWSSKQKRSSTAFQLAEAAANRGLWKLQERPNNWDDTSTSAGPFYANNPGYNNDVSYQSSSDRPTWKYRIQITTGTGSDERKIIGTGAVLKPGTVTPIDTRAVELVMQKGIVNSAIYAPRIQVTGGALVHWGPMTSQSSIDTSGGSKALYPRKFAVSAITPEDPFVGGSTAGPPDSDGNSGDPLSGSWHAWNDVPVPPEPAIDFSYYAQLAKDEEAIKYGGKTVQHYFPGDWTPNNLRDDVGDTKNYSHMDPLTGLATDHVRYVVGTAKFSGGYFIRGVVIAEGDVNFSGGGKGSYTGGLAGYAAPPTSAWREYQSGTALTPTGPGDSAASSEWPADTGGGPPSIVNTTFSFGTGSPALKDGTKDAVSLYGFVFAKNTFNASGGTVIHGAIQAKTTVADGGGSFTVYYRDNLNIKLSYSTPIRKSWREILPMNFSSW